MGEILHIDTQNISLIKWFNFDSENIDIEKKKIRFSLGIEKITRIYTFKIFVSFLRKFLFQYFCSENFRKNKVFRNSGQNIKCTEL